MLQAEERFVIRELYGKGVSISEITRLTGHDRKTIRAALSQPLLPAPRPVRSQHGRPRPSHAPRATIVLDVSCYVPGNVRTCRSDRLYLNICSHYRSG